VFVVTIINQAFRGVICLAQYFIDCSIGLKLKALIYDSGSQKYLPNLLLYINSSFDRDTMIVGSDINANIWKPNLKFENVMKYERSQRFEIFGVFSSHSLTTREKYISFAQFVYCFKESVFTFQFLNDEIHNYFFLT
jgi:hypothetical protein